MDADERGEMVVESDWEFHSREFRYRTVFGKDQIRVGESVQS